MGASAKQVQNNHLELYRQLHETRRFLGTEQSLMAIALLSFNGLAIFQSGGSPAPGLAALMVLAGLFGIAHNNRLVARYEAVQAQLQQVAAELGTEPVRTESEGSRSMFGKMRTWFYLLYGALSAYWANELIQLL